SFNTQRLYAARRSGATVAGSGAALQWVGSKAQPGPEDDVPFRRTQAQLRGARPVAPVRTSPVQVWVSPLTHIARCVLVSAPRISRQTAVGGQASGAADGDGRDGASTCERAVSVVAG